MNSVEICNMALAMAGMPPITSMDENNNNARLCKSFFPVLRDRILRSHFWSFATNYTHLQQLRESSLDPEFPYVCALPVDFLRMVELQEQDYKKVGRNILVKYMPAVCIYIRQVEDPEEFDPSFCACLQYLLASEICAANTRDIQLVNFYKQNYLELLETAKATDSIENAMGHQLAGKSSNFISARFSGSSSFSKVAVTDKANCGKA